ncbi:MAG: IS1 family transposase [Candidatus Electronema sp. V4]|uniref:IS1 family transposase n=1 Tax=Candidatus Electronema sp. V4 TaxID=3454756 RepID=UPI00405572AB
MRRVFTLTTGKAARKYIPPSKHVIGKADTWRIERRNLNFRIHIKRLNRRTIYFSKNEKIHDNVIGMYINRYYFENGRYSESA